LTEDGINITGGNAGVKKGRAQTYHGSWGLGVQRL